MQCTGAFLIFVLMSVLAKRTAPCYCGFIIFLFLAYAGRRRVSYERIAEQGYGVDEQAEDKGYRAGEAS